jgi:hypothetical protein
LGLPKPKQKPPRPSPWPDPRLKNKKKEVFFDFFEKYATMTSKLLRSFSLSA